MTESVRKFQNGDLMSLKLVNQASTTPLKQAYLQAGMTQKRQKVTLKLVFIVHMYSIRVRDTHPWRHITGKTAKTGEKRVKGVIDQR